MDTARSYLAGDIHSLGKVNKIVPRTMALPLLMPSRIQIRRNLFGIKSRFFEHMKSYDYKFKSLAAEPKQVIRALRPKSSCHPRPSASPKPLDRSLVEKSSAWKLPPNVYRLKDHFEEVSKRQMGKLGYYQCFTVERDVRTIKGHYAMKPVEDQCEIFYDLPSGVDELMRPCNRYKSKFLKRERFQKVRPAKVPPPTKYYPQNYVLQAPRAKSPVTQKFPFFYYPNTSVPVKEMAFNKQIFPRPDFDRYEPHDVTCKCYLTNANKRCPGNVSGNGHSYVFKSNLFRLVHPVKVQRRRHFSETHVDDFAIEYHRRPRESIRPPMSFRVKRSASSDDLLQPEREVRFNTMVKKRNLFSVKTGRPVGFLAAMPRFKERSQISINLEKERKRMLIVEEKEKSPRKPMSKKRLEELAAPKNPLPKIAPQKASIAESPASTERAVVKFSIDDSASGLSAMSLDIANYVDEDEVSLAGVNLESEKAVESSTE